MNETREPESVRCWEQQVVIPTYPVQDADPNPMFLEKRVYQGSSGKVYPNPFTDRVALEKIDKTYRAIMLENEYVQLMILPEIGGRIFAGLDKTNGYDFFYRQHVVKPALVGLLGPWISGGVEFNWPQHHRPSTYMPVHAAIEEDPDGSRTVWLSEHDPMLRMKGMVGVSLAGEIGRRGQSADLQPYALATNVSVVVECSGAGSRPVPGLLSSGCEVCRRSCQASDLILSDCPESLLRRGLSPRHRYFLVQKHPGSHLLHGDSVKVRLLWRIRSCSRRRPCAYVQSSCGAGKEDVDLGQCGVWLRLGPQPDG